MSVRPWSPHVAANDRCLGPEDCFLVERSTGSNGALSGRIPGALLLSDAHRELRLLPYPRAGRPDKGLPARPRTGYEPQDQAEKAAADALDRMHEVLARIEDLKTALDDPGRLWERLDEAWSRAGNESNPRMAEIVRQARAMRVHLPALADRIRRILRRRREHVPLGRVQEMDRGCMTWLAQQPGQDIPERAGGDQRVLAIARRESFDTLENRVLRAYLRLASRVARQWLRENRRADWTPRYRAVQDHARRCRRMDRDLADLGIGVAEPGVKPNYVLAEDPDYRKVREAWLKLLRQERPEDDLWAWQAQSWTDFCILAVTLSLRAIEGAALVAQAPLVWMEEATAGQRFRHDRPLAVFWLSREALIVEVQARPGFVLPMQFDCRAWVWLRISDLLKSDDVPRHVPVWTPHCFSRMNLQAEVPVAARFLASATENRRQSMREGLILAPAHDQSEHSACRSGRIRVVGIALDAAGARLPAGMEALRSFIRSCRLEAP